MSVKNRLIDEQIEKIERGEETDDNVYGYIAQMEDLVAKILCPDVHVAPQLRNAIPHIRERELKESLEVWGPVIPKMGSNYLIAIHNLAIMSGDHHLVELTLEEIRKRHGGGEGQEEMGDE